MLVTCPHCKQKIGADQVECPLCKVSFSKRDIENMRHEKSESIRKQQRDHYRWREVPVLRRDLNASAR